MDVSLVRTISGAAPADDVARELFRKWPVGEERRCDIVKPRDNRNLRRWWALCNLVYQNCEQYKSPDQVHQHLKILAGHCTPIVSKSSGEVFLIPDSISYARLEESEFEDVFKRTVAAVCEHILPTVTSRTIEEEILNLLSRVGNVRAA